jgi:Tol biopolymer transport system component
MSAERFDRDFADLLTELAEPRFPDYFDDVLERAVSAKQRPAWTFPERWLPMNVLARRPAFAPALPIRTIALLIALLLVLLATVIVGVGALLLQGQPAPQFGIAANGLLTYGFDGDIYTARADGSEPRVIIGGPTIDVAPAFSRDGLSLSFIRVISDDPEVVAVMAADADGSNVRTLVEPEQSAGIHWHTLSPKGDVLALTNEAVSPRFSILSLSDGTRTALELPVDVGPHEWLPSGEEIVLIGEAASGPARQGIYAVRPDGSGFRTIVEPKADTSIMDLAVSDDGRYIAYSAFFGNIGIWYLVELATGESRLQLAPIGQHQLFPVFAPDVSRVGFMRYSNERGGTIDAQVFVAPIDDPAAAVGVGPSLRIQSGTDGLRPQFSPDAKSVLIVSDSGRLWLADLATSEYQELTVEFDEPYFGWQRRAR